MILFGNDDTVLETIWENLRRKVEDATTEGDILLALDRLENAIKTGNLSESLVEPDLQKHYFNANGSISFSTTGNQTTSDLIGTEVPQDKSIHVRITYIFLQSLRNEVSFVLTPFQEGVNTHLKALDTFKLNFNPYYEIPNYNQNLTLLSLAGTGYTHFESAKSNTISYRIMGYWIEPTRLQKHGL